MKTFKTLATIASFVAIMGTANAAQWKSDVITVEGGQARVHKTVESCNYARTVSLARKEADKHNNAFFNLTSSDNQEACPKKARKPKAE